MMWLIIIILIFGGCIALTLAMSKHRKKFLSQKLSKNIIYALRFGGGGALSISFLLAIELNGSVGPVIWFGIFSMVAVAFVVSLPYIEQEYQKNG